MKTETIQTGVIIFQWFCMIYIVRKNIKLNKVIEKILLDRGVRSGKSNI